MREKKHKPPARQIDHSRTNRNAIITAIILVVIIFSAVTTGLIIIQSQSGPVVPSKVITQSTGPEKSKSRFFLKLYDYIARSQSEIHTTLNKI